MTRRGTGRYCPDVEADDNVVVRAPAEADDLVVALYEQIGERGARPTTSWVNPRAGAAYARAMDVDDFRTKDHRLAAMEETDVVIMVQGARNSAESSDVDPEKAAAAGRARQPVLEERLDTRRVITQHPTPADAQGAEMSTQAWTDFVYDAVNRDWAAQREFQEQLVEILDPADEVRIVAGDHTDLRLSVDGMDVLNDAGEENLPGGEVYTAPVVDGVEGSVAVDYPLRENGREIRGIRLEFEAGEVVDFAAESNVDALGSLLDTDEGARRLGELGMRMNRGIDRFTHTMLFDEKRGSTAHMALENAVEDAVPDEREFNESARHVDCSWI